MNNFNLALIKITLSVSKKYNLCSANYELLFSLKRKLVRTSKLFSQSGKISEHFMAPL